MDLHTVTSTDVQRGFGKFLDNLTEPVIIMRDSRPGAIVLTPRDYRQYEKERKQLATYKLMSLLNKIHWRNRRIPAKEVEKDVEEALKYVRSRRRRH